MGSNSLNLFDAETNQIRAIAIYNLELKVAIPAPTNPNEGIPRLPKINTQLAKMFIIFAVRVTTIAGRIIDKPSAYCLYV